MKLNVRLVLSCVDLRTVTERGRAFHLDAVADWKEHSPMVKQIVRCTIRSEDEAQRNRWRVASTYVGNALVYAVSASL